MHPMLQDWVEARKKSQDLPTEYSDVKLPKLSAATIDRALSAFKLNKPKKTDDRLDLQHNHFIASMRLLKKETCGRRIIKRYDKARTPYARVLENMKEGGRKERFIKLHESLNPWIIQKEITQYSKEIAMLLTQREQYAAPPKPTLPECWAPR